MSSEAIAFMNANAEFFHVIGMSFYIFILAWAAFAGTKMWQFRHLKTAPSKFRMILVHYLLPMLAATVDVLLITCVGVPPSLISWVLLVLGVGALWWMAALLAECRALEIELPWFFPEHPWR